MTTPLAPAFDTVVVKSWVGRLTAGTGRSELATAPGDEVPTGVPLVPTALGIPVPVAGLLVPEVESLVLAVRFVVVPTVLLVPPRATLRLGAMAIMS